MRKVHGPDGFTRDVNIITSPAYDDGVSRTFHLIGWGVIQMVTEPFEDHEEEEGLERRHYLWIANDPDQRETNRMFVVCCSGLFEKKSPLAATIDLENCPGQDWHYMYATKI